MPAVALRQNKPAPLCAVRLLAAQAVSTFRSARHFQSHPSVGVRLEVAGMGRFLFLFLLVLLTGHELLPWPASRLEAQSSGGRREETSVSFKTLRFQSRFMESANWQSAKRQSATLHYTVRSARHFQSHPHRLRALH